MCSHNYADDELPRGVKVNGDESSAILYINKTIYTIRPKSKMGKGQFYLWQCVSILRNKIVTNLTSGYQELDSWAIAIIFVTHSHFSQFFQIRGRLGTRRDLLIKKFMPVVQMFWSKIRGEELGTERENWTRTLHVNNVWNDDVSLMSLFHACTGRTVYSTTLPPHTPIPRIHTQHSVLYTIHNKTQC